MGSLTGIASLTGITSITGLNTPPTGVNILNSNTATSNNATTSPALTGVPAGALLILSCASADDASSATNVNITGTGLTWNKLSENVTDGVHSFGMVEIWAAVFTAGGSITATVAWQGGTTGPSSSVLYSVGNQEAVLGGAAANLSNQTAPQVDITTTRANSIIFCVSSDWNAVSPGSRAYRDSATETLCHNLSPSTYVAYHYYKLATTATLYTEGLTAPTGQGAGTCLLEIRGT
jgi:hypothetical protein